ncbi:ribonuclease H-like domain-containing protein [Tanacetum coccineum]
MGPVQCLTDTTDTNGQIKVLPPKTAEEILAREKERKAMITLLMAIPEDHLAKFHKMTNAKEMWDAIKSRFGGVSTNDAIRSSLVFETDVKGSTRSSSSAQNVAFVSSKSTSSTNDVSTAYGATTSFGYNSQRENSSSFTDELMHSFFANQSSGPQLDHKDLEQIDEFDLEEMDLKWQVAMISMRLKKFYKKTRKKLQFDAKEPVGFDKTKVECFNCHKTGHFARECRSKGNQDIKRRDAGNTGYKAKDNRRDLENRRNLKLWFMKIDLDDKTDVLTYHKKLLAEAVKEKEELKTKLEKWQNSSKGLNKLLDSQMSVKDKIGLGFSGQVKENKLYDEALMSVFDSHSSDIEDTLVYDRFAKVEGMHAVPPPMTGNYMPPKSDFEIDDVETLESVPEPVVIEPKVISQPKVWYDAPIIEEYESDSDDEYVIKPSKEQEKPSFAFVNTVKHVKTPRETIKEQNICSQSPNVDKRDWNGLMSKKLGLGYGFTRKACFVCGSFGHLIRDCDFHEKRMAKQVELNKQKGRGTGQGKNRLVWNNVQAVSTSAGRKVNTVRPIVNDVRPRNIFYKTYSPIRRPFNRTTEPRTNFSNQKVNTAGDKAVSVVGGIRETAVKTSAGCNWRSKRHYWNKFSKYNGGSNSRKCDDPQKTLKGKGIVDSGCFRHMTGNKAYLVEYQEFQGGSVVFGGSKGRITGKGKIRTGKLDIDNVYFVKELQDFNLFSVSQMCDKKNKVLFTDTECLVLSPDFKLPDENQVLLRIPRQNNMYSFNLENIVPTRGLACLIAMATVNESNKWHRRLGHVNFIWGSLCPLE